MPQKRIPLESEQAYHVWTHANGSDNLFRCDENYCYFLEKYSYYVHPVVETFSYCLMPNHLHLMVRVRSKKEVLKFLRDKKGDSTINLQGFQNLGGFSNIISQQFSNLFNSYTKAYNKRYDRKGSLFIPNFNRKLIDSKDYFTRLIVYIHNNPVHHGFVKDPADWPHSSWHAYLHHKKTKVNTSEGLAWFGNRNKFEAIHRELKEQELVTLLKE